MNRIRKVSLLATVVLLAFASSLVSAQQQPRTATKPEPTPAVSAEPEAAATNHVIEKTYFNWDVPEFFNPVASGLQGIDPLTTITCPGSTGTCTIEVQQTIQILPTSNSPDQFSLCVEVDGSTVSCPTLLGPLPAEGTYTSVAFNQIVSDVSHGTHKIQSAIETANGIDVGFFTFTYRVYKP